MQKWSVRMTDKISLLLVDDHALVRQGIRAFLELQEDLTVLGDVDSGEAGVDMVAELVPDVVLMDLVMPGIGGVEATRQVKQVSPHSQVIVLTSYYEDEYIFPALGAGALSYVLKDIGSNELADTIRKAARGESVLHPRVASRVVQELRGSLNAADKQPNSGIIKVLAGAQKNNVIHINKLVTTIGSDPSNDIVLADHSVSQHHARILHSNRSWSIETVSQDDTLDVNKRNVQQAMIHDYDIVGIGTETTFIFLLSLSSQALSDSISRNTQPLLDDQSLTSVAATLPSEPSSIEQLASPSQQSELPQQASPQKRIQTRALPYSTSDLF